MNPRLVLLIVVIIVAVVAALAFLAYRGVRANAGVRRREYELMRRERNTAYETVRKIENTLGEYREIDHPLASKLGPIVREFNEERWEIRK